MKAVKKRDALTEKSLISAGGWGGTESRAQILFRGRGPHLRFSWV